MRPIDDIERDINRAYELMAALSKQGRDEEAKRLSRAALRAQIRLSDRREAELLAGPPPDPSWYDRVKEVWELLKVDPSEEAEDRADAVASAASEALKDWPEDMLSPELGCVKSWFTRDVLSLTRKRREERQALLLRRARTRTRRPKAR